MTAQIIIKLTLNCAEKGSSTMIIRNVDTAGRIIIPSEIQGLAGLAASVKELVKE